METTRVTVEELKERMDRGEEFAFIDVRNPEAWRKAETKLPGAIRMLPAEFEQRLGDIPPGRSIISYCT